MSDSNAVQTQDIMQMNPLEMSEEQIMQRYSTKQAEPAAVDWKVSDEARQFIQRYKRENPHLSEDAIMQMALRNGRSDYAKTQSGYSGRGGVGKQGVTANAIGFGGTGSRSRSFSQMQGAKK